MGFRLANLVKHCVMDAGLALHVLAGGRQEKVLFEKNEAVLAILIFGHVSEDAYRKCDVQQGNEQEKSEANAQ